MADKELVIPDENGTKINQITQNKNVIKNPEVELDKNQTKIEPKKNILISGSNYQNIVPNVGVYIKEEEKSKNGGLDFKNQFGRMSMKEYELLRRKYAQNNETNFHQNYFNYNYDNNYNNINENNEKEKWKRSETFDKNKYYPNYNKNNNNQEIQDSNKQQIINNLYFNSNDYHIHNIGLKHYDWGSDEKTTMPEISNNNLNIRNIYQNNINIDNNGRKVLNENLFKRSVKKKHSIYREYYSDKNVNYKINKDKNSKDINYFNNQIMQNKNWGNVNDTYKVGRTNFSNSIKKSDGMNMRTRKKL